MRYRSSRRCRAADRIHDLRFAIYDLCANALLAPHFTRRAVVKRQLTITLEPIDEAALASKRRMSDGMGAVVYFAGVVRAAEENRAIHAIEYEAFQQMAEHQFNLVFSHLNGESERTVALGRSGRPASRRGLRRLPMADRRTQTRRADLEKAVCLSRRLHLLYDSPIDVEPLSQVKVHGLDQHAGFEFLPGGHVVPQGS